MRAAMTMSLQQEVVVTSLRIAGTICAGATSAGCLLCGQRLSRWLCAGGQDDHTGGGNYMPGYTVGADRMFYEAYMKALKPKSGQFGC
jgi:hypothetical protein